MSNYHPQHTHNIIVAPSTPVEIPPVDFVYNNEDLCRMIANRMRWVPPQFEGRPICQLAYLSCYESKEKVHVTLAVKQGDAPIQIDDDRGLFPSDAFITQLRLLVA